MTDYTKTTDFTSKDSLPSGDSGKIIRGAEFGTEFDNIETAVNSKSNINNPAFTGNITVTGTVDGRDIATDGTKLDTIETSADVTDTANVTAAGAVMDSELTDITAVKALNQGVATTDSPTFAAVTSTGNVTVGGTVDGRDVAADGTKLDTVETNADVTDTTNVTAAGALMDSEVTNLAQVKAFDSADYATAAQGTTADNALPKTGGAMTGAITTNSTFDGRDVATDGAKLDGIEASADVTDTANVTAAGALMDSELTSIASVKALNQGVATTDSPTFAGVTANGTVEFDGLSGTGAVTVTDILDQDDMSGNSATALATQQSIKAYVDSQVATADTLSEVLANGNATGGTDIAFGDGDKALFGAGSDLQLYHDGSNSYISDQGTGNLLLETAGGSVRLVKSPFENMLVANVDGAVQLYYDNSQKLATTSTGIDVTGTATMDGLTVTGTLGNFAVDTQGAIATFSRPSTSYIRASDVSGSLRFDAGGSLARLNIAANGDISFYEDTGTTAKLTWDSSAESLILAGSDLGTAGIFVESSTAGVGARLDTIDATISNGASLTNSLLLDSDNHAIIRMDSNNNGSGDFYITESSSDTARLRVVNNGNIQFFEDTGVTPKFHWDASAESLGIGTSNPNTTLQVSGVNSSTNADALFSVQKTTEGYGLFSGVLPTGVSWLQGGTSNDSAYYNVALQPNGGSVGIGTASPALSSKLHVSSTTTALDTGGTIFASVTDAVAADIGGQVMMGGHYTGTTTAAFGGLAAKKENATAGNFGGYLQFLTSTNGLGNTEKMRIDSNGNVGIGAGNSKEAMIQSTNSGRVASNPAYSFNGDLDTGMFNPQTDNTIAFATGGTEACRIDSSRNLLVGTTSITGRTDASSGEGIALSAGSYGGFIGATRSGANPLALNRLSSDGAVATFAKDGTTLGSIGVYDGRPYLASTTVGIRVSNALFPSNTSGVITDGAMDIGGSSGRFRNLHLSGGLRGDTTFKNNAGTTEYARFDSSGNLLVGTTDNSPVGNNVADGIALLANGSGQLSRDGGTALLLNRKTNDGELLRFNKDGSAVGSIGTVDGDLLIYPSASGHKGLRFGNGYIAPTNNAGTIEDGVADLGLTTHRFKNLHLSGGVLLGGSTAANKLDDYEEGTWTPSFADASTGGNVATVASGLGSYTKVGNLVTVGCRFLDIDITGLTSSNAIYIRGLPFTAGTTEIRSGSAFLDRFTFSGYVTAYAAGSHVLLFNTATGVQDAALLVSSVNSAGSDVAFTLQYQV